MRAEAGMPFQPDLHLGMHVHDTGYLNPSHLSLYLLDTTLDPERLLLKAV
jgi:hypothetical protein